MATLHEQLVEQFDIYLAESARAQERLLLKSQSSARTEERKSRNRKTQSNLNLSTSISKRISKLILGSFSFAYVILGCTELDYVSYCRV